MIHTADAKVPRPQGFVRPGNTALEEIFIKVEKSQFDEAISGLTNFKSDPGTLDFFWRSYLKGVAHFGKKDLDQGYTELSSVYEQIRSSKKSLPPETFRLLGACLKKIGWYFRSKKEFDRAYAYHAIEMSYFEKYGSPLEIHDAAISLDVDSYSLGDMRLSEMWLLKSIEAAKQIHEPKSKNHSLGVSYNNIAGTLYSLERFEEAEGAIKKSLEFWKAYEAEAGDKEFKVVWAHFGVGDVYQEWANYLKSNSKDHKQKKALSLEAYKKSFSLAEKLNTPVDVKTSIQERIGAVTGLE